MLEKKPHDSWDIQGHPTRCLVAIDSTPRTRHACDSHELGRRGEAAAARHLSSKGWEILERNWRWNHGEVDIIAHEPTAPENCVTLIEVKTRRCRPDSDEVVPELAIDERKRRRYLDSARRYLQLHPHFEFVRFDAIAITVRDGGGAHLHHVPHAFQAEQ